jgi:trigger factor
MRSNAEILEGNKVKLTVEVDEDELKTAVDDTFRRLQREVSVPGFRPGKVPRRLLEARMGGKAIREEVIRQALPDYYAQAVEEAALDTIAAPEIDITSGQEDGPLAFDAVVEIRPKVSVAGRDGLVVTVPSPEVSDEELDAQIDRMREQFAELSEVERPARDGDVVTVDVQATRDGEPVEDLATADFVYEVGTGMLAEGADEQLRGAKAGDILDIDASEAPGGGATLKILVKQVREKVLPDADDAWASDASEFDTIAELRADMAKRVTGLRTLQARLALREGAITALASLVQEEMPDTLVGEATQRQLATFVRRLEARKVSLDQYMEATDLDADGLIAQMRAMANEEVRADLALRALADSEGLEVTDAELAAEISRVAAEANRSESEVARQVAEGGGLERLRSDIRNSKAVEWLLDHVEVVDEQGNPMDRALLLEHDGSPDEPRDTTVDESVDSPETADTIAEAADPSDTEESRA